MGGTGIRSNVGREFKLFLVFSRPLSIFPVDIRKCVILFMAETGRKKRNFLKLRCILRELKVQNALSDDTT